MSIEIDKANGAACPVCGGRATDYCADRWACDRCGFSGPLTGATADTADGVVAGRFRWNGYPLDPEPLRIFTGPEKRLIYDAEADPDGWFTTSGQLVWIGVDLAGPSACDTCTNEGSCKTIGQCLRYKCEFGKVDKP
jgi:hypothetical protein